MNENTTTPNGDSKYLKNEDTGKQVYNITDMSQHDPAKDLTGTEPGDNTVTEVSVSVDNTAIRDFGSVSIPATLVGQPMKDGPEAKDNIKLSVAEAKRVIQARGAITAEQYIANKAKGKGKDEKQTDKSEKDEKAQEQEELKLKSIKHI